MARITVEDCIDKVDSPYELVMVAKERAVQLNSGAKPSVEPENDKNTVISLREIAEEKILVKNLESEAVYKLRKHVEQTEETNNEDEIVGDDFENLYKGEASKSGAPILPSKRARKIPEKIQTVHKEDVEKSEEVVPEIVSETLLENEDQVSLEDLKEKENLEDEIVEEENKN